LDALIHSIDPSFNFEPVSTRVNAAMNSFPLDTLQPKDWSQFQRLLTGFFCHLENRVLRLQPPRSPDDRFDWSRCFILLKKEYGEQADKAAFEMARTGVEGGLYGVLKKVAEKMAENYADNEISARIHSYWNGLSTDEKLAASEEYLQKHGHLLPSELTEGSAARIRANFPKVLLEHARMKRRMKNINRR